MLKSQRLLCYVSILEGSWSKDLSTHHSNPCELTFGFGGLGCEFAIFVLTIFSKSLLVNFYFWQDSIGHGGCLTFLYWVLDEIFFVKSYLLQL